MEELAFLTAKLYTPEKLYTPPRLAQTPNANLGLSPLQASPVIQILTTD